MEEHNADVAAGTMVQVLQAGYMIEDRVLRPAMVVVAKGGFKPVKAPEQVAKTAAGPRQPTTTRRPPAMRPARAAPRARHEDDCGAGGSHPPQGQVDAPAPCEQIARAGQDAVDARERRSRASPPSTTTSPDCSVMRALGIARVAPTDVEHRIVAERDRDHRRHGLLLVGVDVAAELRARTIVRVDRGKPRRRGR